MNDDDDGPPEFYWWSRLVYGLMTNLHCSEREVLSMRWDRATAYLDEILIDLGKSVSRPLPESSLKGFNFAGLIGVATAGAGITGIGMKIQQLGAGLEMTRMGFQTMLGDAEKGNAMLAKLNEFANFTPFSNEEIIQSGKTLLAYGVPAGNIEGLLKRLGDASAGSGKKIAELAPIFGKVFAKGISYGLS